MPGWPEHPDIFDIPDVTAECDEMRPTVLWRIVQFGNSCRQECAKTRKRRANDWAQVVAIMQKLAKTGHIRNEEQYKHEFDDVYAIKGRRGIRALGTLQTLSTESDRPVFVVLGWLKKQRKSLSRQEVNRIKDRRKVFATFIKDHCNENWKTTQSRRRT